MNSQSWQEWFEAAWADREERIYKQAFGSLGAGIYPLSADLFTDIFGAKKVDPRWLTIGVFECPPNERRDNWLYVSSGLSNAWEADSPDPESWSGIGCELLMQCSSQSTWAMLLLRKLVTYQLLLSVGHFGDRPPLNFFDRMAVGQPLNGESSELQALMFAPSTDFPSTQSLPSGKFEFIQVLGITQSELQYAKEHSSEELMQQLLSANAVPVVNLHRKAVL
jgi:Suppressor of fused protein (SUFU)